MVSRRGSNTVAARWAAPASCRKRAYSKPNCAAGRWLKSRIVVTPVMSTPWGRTRAAVTSRWRAPISMPTPEPNAVYFLRSVMLRGPGIVVPAQHIDPGAVVGPPETHRCGHHAPQVRELPVGQADACGGAEGIDTLTADAQTGVGFAATWDETRDFTGILERLLAPAGDDSGRALRRDSDRHQDSRLGRVDINTVHMAERRDAV